MRRRAVLALLVLLLTACGGDAPTRPGSETIDRAREIAEQLDQREADLEDSVGDGGG